jgi:hypothetical protein
MSGRRHALALYIRGTRLHYLLSRWLVGSWSGYGEEGGLWPLAGIVHSSMQIMQVLFTVS